MDKFINTTFAGCKIIEKLGQGGMGAVYKAHNAGLDKIVCIKMLSTELARESRNVEFFLREARSAAKLDHPNIVQIYHFGQENGQYFIIMSYVEGKSLADIISEGGPLPVSEATRIIVDILEALEHAHSKSIVHRDIKPQNILISKDGQIKLVDFGLARSITEEKQLTIAGELVGTAYFMSPEQGLAQKVDHRADLYSTGATYYYILMGQYPFEGKTSLEVIHKHITETLPNIALRKPEIPLWVSKVIETLMRKKPQDRYQTAGDAVDDILKNVSAPRKRADGSERTLNIPSITEKIKEEEPEPGEPETPDGIVIDRYSIEEQVAKPKQEAKAEPAAKPSKPVKIRSDVSINFMKLAGHIALTTAVLACFLTAGVLPSNLTRAMGPIFSNPLSSALLILLGMAGFVWALVLKPFKFTGFYAAAAVLLMFFSYLGGTIVEYPPDISGIFARIYHTILLTLANLAAKDNLIIYSVFFYFIGSKLSLKKAWTSKFPGFLISAAGIACAYAYFRLPAQDTGNAAFLIASVLLFGAGMAAGVMQKEFSFIWNPYLLFLASNASIALFLSLPQIEVIKIHKIKEDRTNVEKLRKEDYAKKLQGIQASEENYIPEYDSEGRPIEKPKTKINVNQEIKPTPENELKNQAVKEYLRYNVFKFRENAGKSGGYLLISLFLLLLLNVNFFEEIIYFYKKVRYLE